MGSAQKETHRASPSLAATRPAFAPKGRIPVRVWESDAHDRYLRLCLRVWGRLARPSAQKADKIRHSLEQAHMEYLPETYLSFVWMNTALSVAGASVLVTGVLALALAAGALPPAPVAAILLALPLLLGSIVYVAQAVYPDYKAGERRRAIDRDLPYAVNFIAAMSSAGVVPAVLLRDLAREKTYGEVSREVAWIVRDLDLMGVDLLTALQRATGRTPSRKFQEFLQGAKTTILSGGELKAYFLSKADQYMADNRRTQKEFIESLGLLAESYVTVVIAGPLFMIVMLSIMLLIGSSNVSSEAFLFMLTFIMLPIAHASFAWIIKNMAPEG